MKAVCGSPHTASVEETAVRSLEMSIFAVNRRHIEGVRRVRIRCAARPPDDLRSLCSPTDIGIENGVHPPDDLRSPDDSQVANIRSPDNLVSPENLIQKDINKLQEYFGQY